jgi:small GTP-binding protein
MSREPKIKITILGDEGVGKKTFLNNILSSGKEENDSIGLKIKYYEFHEQENNKRITVEIKIPASQERNKLISKVVYEDNDGFIILFDLNDTKSFDNLKIWIQNIKDYSRTNYLKLIIGNKCDLPRIIEKKDFKTFANENNSFYEEVDSIHNSKQCKKIFDDFIKNIYNHKKDTNNKNEQKEKVIKTELEEKAIKCDCCPLF